MVYAYSFSIFLVFGNWSGWLILIWIITWSEARVYLAKHWSLNTHIFYRVSGFTQCHTLAPPGRCTSKATPFQHFPIKCPAYNPLNAHYHYSVECQQSNLVQWLTNHKTTCSAQSVCVILQTHDTGLLDSYLVRNTILESYLSTAFWGVLLKILQSPGFP
jgi:hypothetical protein